MISFKIIVVRIILFKIIIFKIIMAQIEQALGPANDESRKEIAH
jgi:hypothetical protein